MAPAACPCGPRSDLGGSGTLQPGGYPAPVLQFLDLRGVTNALGSQLPRPNLAGEGPVAEVRAIVADVRAHGDSALREYTRRFDGVELDRLAVSPEEIAAAPGRIEAGLLEALTAARDSIDAFYRHRAPSPGASYRLHQPAPREDRRFLREQ